MVSRSIENAQRKVEARNFDIRKQLLEYDNVANDQRQNIYRIRNDILEGTPEYVAAQVKDFRDGVITDYFHAHVPPESIEEQWDLEGLQRALAAEVDVDVPVKQWLEADSKLDEAALQKRIIDETDRATVERMAAAPPDVITQYQRFVMLQVMDHEWREHLGTLDHLRQGIHLRGYAQKNPRQEYKREGFELFGAMLETVKLEVTRTLMKVRIRSAEEVEKAEAAAPTVQNVTYQHAEFNESALAGDPDEVATAVLAPPGARVGSSIGGDEESKTQPFVRGMGKIGRNDPCPCGSGKKYKQCHGRLT